VLIPFKVSFDDGMRLRVREVAERVTGTICGRSWKWRRVESGWNVAPLFQGGL
jgi:hypothetical protein